MPTQLKYALESERNRTERFIQLYARNQQALFSYVLALVPKWADAVLVTEATHLVLWRRFEQYQDGTNFVDWATKEAKEEVLKYRVRRKKEWLCFSADVVSKLDRELQSMGEMLRHQRESLPACLAKLPERPRVLLYHRYRDSAKVHQVAEKMSCADSTVRQSLQRVRKILLECYQKNIGGGATILKRLSASQELEVETLCSALFDDTITPDQFRLLQVYLRISASSRQLYIQYRNLHGALAAACAYEVLPTHSYGGMSSHDCLASGNGRREIESSSSSTQDSSTSTMAQDSKSTGGAKLRRASISTALISTMAAALKTSGPGVLAQARHMVMGTLSLATKHITATSLSTASLVTVLTLVIMAAFTPPGRRLLEQLTTTEPVATDPSTTGNIARLIKAQACQWMDPAQALAIGTELKAGQQIKLAKGLVEIRYRDGAQVILQGPVVFEMWQLGRSYLALGKLTATIPKSAIGYTVETPNARVVDMGTEFAVEVLPDERSEVHVFQGRVEAQRLSESGPTGELVSLTAGKAALIEFGTEQKSISTFAANEARYQRTLDRTTTLAIKKALWRKATKRLRLDPDLVLYYTFAGSGDRQHGYVNQAKVANEQFPCALTGRSEQSMGLTQVRGRWPWSAALDFTGDVDKYLRVVNRANSREAITWPGPTMSLVVTVGSRESSGGMKVAAGDAVSDLATGLYGPVLHGSILMNRHSHSENFQFQLALIPPVDRDHSERVEFRLDRAVEAYPQVDANEARRTDNALHGKTLVGSTHQVSQEDQHDMSSGEIVLSAEVDLAQPPWHQLVVVCDQASVRLYWDSKQVGEYLLDEPFALQLEELSIGHGITVSPEGKIREVGFTGLIDDLAVFKRPLKEAEIQNMAALY